MSTVQDVLNLIQFRVDNQEDVYHVMNSAIKMVTKRLYLLDSDITVSTLSVAIKAAQDYTASIAFNAAANTITDAASQFVVEGFAADMPITTSSTTNPGPFRIQSVAAGTLTIASSTPVVTEVAASHTIYSDDSYGYLPSDFWGLKDKPYLSPTNGYPLYPLPSVDVALSYTSAGMPLYYQVRNGYFYVTPHTSSSYTVMGDYIAMPTALTALGDTVPYYGLFDDAIAEITCQLYKKEMNLLNVFQLVSELVDSVAIKRDRKAPQGMPGGIDWDNLAGRY